MNLDTVVQDVSSVSSKPEPAQLKHWCELAYQAGGSGEDPVELTVRIVDEKEGAYLNTTYRRKPGATNVLSFPVPAATGGEPRLLGDIVICAPVVEREAREQGKSREAHWLHMVIHGVLHLCGYSHADEADSSRMESLESDLITGLGYPDPYGS